VSSGLSVKKEILVEASQERAFKVFTSGIDRWWPRQHHVGTSPMKRTAIEPHQGGRWYAECQDGSECDTGKVLAWDPPRRVLLAWQLTAQWKFDPDFITEVEVTFTAKGLKQTLVVLEHRNLERFGADAPALQKSIGKPDGWPGILAMFAEAAARDQREAGPETSGSET
jgi:uncharacterized protein YndB with AHSA1/START domain